MPDPAIRVRDPGGSIGWIVAPACCAALAAVVAYLVTAAVLPAFVGGLLGLGIGFLANLVLPIRDWVSRQNSTQVFARRSGSVGTILDRDLTSLRVHRSDLDVTEFAPRDRLADVVTQLRRNNPVLIYGPSMSGKTRLAVEVLRRHWGQNPLFFPTTPDSLKDSLVDYEIQQETVVFLDDVERFLVTGLRVTDIDHWLNDKGGVVLATMMQSEYDKYSSIATSERSPYWDLVNRFTPIPLSARPSKQELLQLDETGYADLALEAEEYGLPALLGGAPLLRRRFEVAASHKNACWALVQAAIDCRRVGIGAATPEQLTTIAAAYVKNYPVVSPAWNGAWEWATLGHEGQWPLLLNQGDGRWLAHDLISDDDAPNAASKGNGPPSRAVPPNVLEIIASWKLPPTQCVALALYLRGRDDIDNLMPTVRGLIREAWASSDNRTRAQLAALGSNFLRRVGLSPIEVSEILKSGLRLDPMNRSLNADLARHLVRQDEEPDLVRELLIRASESSTYPLADDDS